MSDFIQDLLNRLEKELKSINAEPNSVLQKAEQAIRQTYTSVRELREYVLANPFPSQADEIVFFKEVKPRFVCHLIYFVNLFNIESRRPKGGVETQKKYLQRELKRLGRFSMENLEFYRYYRSQSTFLDDRYFLRGRQDIRLYLDNIYAFSDPDFSTSHDMNVARILAYDQLENYLQTELDRLVTRVPVSDNTHQPPNLIRFEWTDNKTDLVELIYALVSVGSLNKGKVDIKELTTFFEFHFQIKLGEVYRTFLSIRDRTNKTKYLDTLREKLLQKMQEEQ